MKAYFSNQPVLKAYLFGSEARGEAKKGSDVDFLVELDLRAADWFRFYPNAIEFARVIGKKS